MSRVKQLLLFSLCSTFALAQETGKKDYKNDLEGKVKSVRITTYVAMDKGGGNYGKGSIAKGMDNMLTYYDKKGNVTERVVYYTNGAVWYTKKYIYEGYNLSKPAEKPAAKTPEPKKENEEGITHESLKGRVTYRYDKKGQKTEESSFDAKGALLWRYVYRYDTRGNVAERDSYDNQAVLVSRESNRYDSNNHIIEKVITMKNQTAYKCTWKYDDKGNPMEKEEYFTELMTPEKLDRLVIDEVNTKGVLRKKLKYTYDAKGNRTEVNIYDAQERVTAKPSAAAPAPKQEETSKEPTYEEIEDPKLLFTNEYDNLGNLWKKDTYVYDKAGQILEVKSVDNEQKPFFRYAYKYDSRGNEIERINYDKSNEIIQRTTQVFDDQGQLIERAEYDSYGELIQKNTYKYNEKGQRIEQKGHNTDNSLAFVIKYVYNNVGECVQTTTFNNKGEETSKLIQQYKVDAHKNWTNRTQYSNGKATYITERVIEYYK